MGNQKAEVIWDEFFASFATRLESECNVSEDDLLYIYVLYFSTFKFELATFTLTVSW